MKPKSLRQIPDKRFLEAVDSAADATQPRIRRHLAAALQSFAESIGILSLGRATQHRNLPAVLTSSDWQALERSISQLHTDPALTQRAALRSARRSLQLLPDHRPIPDGLLEARAERYGQGRLASLWRQLRTSTRQGIERAMHLTHQFSDQLGVFALGRLMRAQIGSTAQQLGRTWQAIREEVAAINGRKLSPRLLRRLDAVTRQRILERANRIAQEEAYRAAVAGQLMAWEVMADAVPIRGLGGLFVSRNGEWSSGPTLHPNCRCGTRLILIEGEFWLEWVTRIYGACPRCIAFDGVLRGRPN